MNDEKTAVINMVSEGAITASEGVALFVALCALEGMGTSERDVEAEDPKHLPPWEFGEGELHHLLGQNKCAKTIAAANQRIISALRGDELQGDHMKDMSSEASIGISALDVLQLSRFRPAASRGGNGGFTSGRFRMKRNDNGLRTHGWGFWMSSWMHTEVELPPTWCEPMLMQVISASGGLRLKWKADEVVEEERDNIRVVSRAEAFDDLVTTTAGKFNDCLKLKTVISALGDEGIEDAPRHDMNNKLRMMGTQSIWFAPNAGCDFCALRFTPGAFAHIIEPTAFHPYQL